MMCGGDGGNVVQKKWVLKWVQVDFGWWCVCVHKKIFFGLT